MYRWWMPLAYTDDDELRRELRDIAAGGAGGVEVDPMIVPGAGHQSNAFLAQYGWGTPNWEHKIEMITDEAAKLGLEVDQNLGPAYPPTVPTLNSFNQPQVEQQLIYGREFDAPGTSRTGSLPTPVTAPPSVTTTLCAPSAAGDSVLHVTSLGGLAAGDTVTVGTGADVEKVVVTGLGDRTVTCGDLSVSPLANAHATSETAVDVARTTRIKTLVAQCASACSTSTIGSVALDPASVVDVTGQVFGGRLDYAFPAGNGNPWVVIDFLQTASGLIAQSGGYTETQPNYVVDHWNRDGVAVQTNFWDDKILTDPVQANLDKIGRGAIFEDSLELGTAEKWTWNFLQSFQSLRGYDPTLLLPALAGAGIQGTGTPAFDLAGVGAQVREDYRQTLSDLYTTTYVAPMQRWAQSHGLQFRVQSYGVPIASGDAAAAAGVAEGESLNFNGDSAHRLAEDDYKVLAGGAHASNRNVISTECCAAFLGNFRSSVAGPNINGQYGQGGDGSGSVGGKSSQGLLDSIYQAYAGGVNQLVWHGYAYRDAPAGVGTAGRDGGTWPGYHPWDIYGALNVNDEFGPRQASWPDYASVNDELARTQEVLRQGHSTSDVAVYYEDLGLSGNSVGSQQSTQHMLGSGSATASAGYTYEYLSPALLAKATPDADGDLFADTSDYHALVLNNQSTMSVANAQRLVTLAEDGLRIFVVGATPTSTTGADPDAAQLADIVTTLLAQPTVTRVPTEAALPAALKDAGIHPAITPAQPTSALGLVRRQAAEVSYDYVYNRSESTVSTDLTLTGSGTPYLLDTWTGKIDPIGAYTSDTAGVRVHVRIPAHDKVVLALAPASAGLGAAPTLHATRSTADVTAASGATVTVRAVANGRYTTALSDGSTRTTEVTGLPAARPLNSWTLTAQTWTPGANEYTTVKTTQPTVTLTADGSGGLPSWREITGPVDLTKSSGIGTYTTTVTLPSTWSPSDGAYVALGDVLDTATVTVNGADVVVNQADRGRIDLGTALHPGSNTLTVRVATTMFNAVRSTGDSNYQLPDWQRTGLMGPVVLTPYRDTTLTARKPAPPGTTKATTSIRVKLAKTHVRTGRRVKAIVTISPSTPTTVRGTVTIRIDGRDRRSVTVSGSRIAVRLPRLGAGKHHVRAIYAGSSTVTGSRSKAVKLTVTRRR
ncbi:glycosyl hydrolase [Nocardioides sp. BP30]|uniref:glycosyl hydrolase n=1 Tax=Nocardioides sp. BP30 TaxID=3036374 RepID=UPI0024689B63|nr:glycosyl hydrolase [Nocardioides sp. BP30]WGL51429.1 glycosyl hydrolase [Nocardioides sp. BP30]